MSSGASDAKKRSKKRYGAGHQSKRWKGSRELEVGMQGILITCNMNERKCTAEAFNLLNEYAEKLYGPEKVSPGFTDTRRPRSESVCKTTASANSCMQWYQGSLFRSMLLFAACTNPP